MSGASKPVNTGRTRCQIDGFSKTALMTAPRPTSTSADPPRGCGPAWERPGARPAASWTQGVSCHRLQGSRRGPHRFGLLRVVLEARPQQRVIARVVEQERVVAVRRLDLGIAHAVA